MKKIMFVCQSLGSGGAERVVSVLSKALDKTEYQIFILAMNSREAAYSIEQTVRVLVPEKTIKGGNAGKLQRIATIRKEITRNNIDVVIAFSHYNAMFSVLAASGLKVRVIGSERNDPAQIQNRKVINILRNVLYSKLDCLVCQTNDAKAFFSDNIQKKSVIIMNPISDDLPAPFEGEREKRIVTFCRLDKQKNIPMLIDAFEKLYQKHAEYVLDIYGDGPEKENLIKYIEEKGLRSAIHLHPFCKDIHNQVRKASAFALSSNYEGLSNSMIEAMAIGLPTVVTDCPCGGAKMVIEDGVNGILVPVGDSDAMGSALLSVIEQPEYAKRLAEEGKIIRDILDSKVIANHWKRVIDLL